MATFKKGDAVRQVVAAPIVGTVVGFDIDQQSGDVQLLVEWNDGEEKRQRHFTESQLEAVEQPTAE
jgi:hypothetical protein